MISRKSVHATATNIDAVVAYNYEAIQRQIEKVALTGAMALRWDFPLRCSSLMITRVRANLLGLGFRVNLYETYMMILWQ